MAFDALRLRNIIQLLGILSSLILFDYRCECPSLSLGSLLQYFTLLSWSVQHYRYTRLKQL